MLNFILNKLAIKYAVYLARMTCLFEMRTHKLHVDYDLRGIAKISAIDKLELDRDADEVFYTNECTALVTDRFKSGYYAKHRILVNECGTVDMDSFRAIVVTSDGKERILNREEYQVYVGYRQDQARVVYPDGRVITDPAFVTNVIRGNQKIDSFYEVESECAGDETFALAAV